MEKFNFETDFMLPNRYGTEIFLRETTDNVWILNKPNDMGYMRVAYTDDTMKTVYMIDPEGGPFLAIGTELEIGTIKAISWIETPGEENPGVWSLLIEP